MVRARVAVVHRARRARASRSSGLNDSSRLSGVRGVFRSACAAPHSAMAKVSQTTLAPFESA